MTQEQIGRVLMISAALILAIATIVFGVLGEGK